MFIVTSERKSEQTWEREDFQLLGEFFLLFFFSLSSLVWTHWWEVFWFVCVGRRVCVSAMGLWVPGLWHSVCSRPHHVPLCSASHTEALSFRAQCRLTEGSRREGAAGAQRAWGERNRIGWKLQHSIIWKKFFVFETLTWAASIPSFSPLPCVRSEQQSALYADSSAWVVCLWMLAATMCHVLCILSQSVSCVNTRSVYVGFIGAGAFVCFWYYVEIRHLQWFIHLKDSIFLYIFTFFVIIKIQRKAML